MKNSKAARVPTRLRSFAGVAVLAGGFFIAGCSGGGASGSGSLPPGTVAVNPATGSKFIVEDNRGGNDSRLVITNITWGRLVDIFDEETIIDPISQQKSFVRTLQFEDFQIGDNIQTGVDFLLERNPVTAKENLIIRYKEGTASYISAFDQLEQNAQPLLDKGLTATPPFTAMPRNACMVVHFQDLVDHDTINVKTIQAATGYPPVLPFEARIVPDMTHGDLLNGEFHTTRVLVDMTVSKIEAQSTNPPLVVNSLGMPEAQVANQPNVIVRIPTQTNSSVGQFDLLRNLSGRALAFVGNGSTDPNSSTADVVRAFRSSSPNLGDPNNGFLVDRLPPRVLGVQGVNQVVITDGGIDPAGNQIYDGAFKFNTQGCASAPVADDVLSLPGHVAIVTNTGSLTNNQASGLRLRLLSGDPATFFSTLALPHPQGEFNTTYKPNLVPAPKPECFVRFSLAPGIAPNQRVNPQTSISVLFSEPMDPASVQAFDSFEITRVGVVTASVLQDKVVGRVVPSLDLREFTFVPTLPLTHANGSSETYDVTLFSQQVLGAADLGAVDLAGNSIEDLLPTSQFFLDSSQPDFNTSGHSLNFSSLDEDGDGFPELRGQVLFDLETGAINPRPVTRFSAVGDSTVPLVGAMIPFPYNIQTPLSNHGSKLHSVYRYADLGLGLTDEGSHNIDVEFMAWAPFAGVQIDNYSEFLMGLSHSLFLPDEVLNMGLLPNFPFSGLVKTFNNNFLDPVNDPQKIVHAKSLGYTVQPLEQFFTPTGALMMPWPMNRAGGAPIPPAQRTTYTWRDTGITVVGGPSGGGVDLQSLAQVSGATPGLFPANFVPTVGLPLLTEIRCYPDAGAFGLNGFKINLAINSSSRPNFRAFSTGGVLGSGQVITIDPDNEPVATSGVNPVSGTKLPPGTEVDNSFYEGQVDFVVRISRAHTIWFDTGAATSAFAPPVIEPAANLQPSGTSVAVAFRGATTVMNTGPPPVPDHWHDATKYNFYGNPNTGNTNPGRFSVTYLNGDPTWKSDPSLIAGAPFFQLRISMTSNPDSTLTPTLSAVGVSYSF